MFHPLALAIFLVTAVQPVPAAAQEPYSCRMYQEAQRKCAANAIGRCYVQHEVDRLRAQCLRDGGRP